MPEDATISVFDRGFLYGESVYETLVTRRGKPVFLAEHMDRLLRSADRIGLRLPVRGQIETALERTLAAGGNAESRVRITVTAGGGGKVDLGPDSASMPTVVVFVQPLVTPTDEMYAAGVAAEIVSVVRNHPGALDPAIKSGNYLNNLLALREARARRPDVHEAIMCSAEGYVAEGASSNVFAVLGGRLETPGTGVGILEGVTRNKVIELAHQEAVVFAETAFTAERLREADEIFITSAARGILPVTTLDGAQVGAGAPGPITRKLMQAYQKLVDRVGAA